MFPASKGWTSFRNLEERQVSGLAAKVTSFRSLPDRQVSNLFMVDLFLAFEGEVFISAVLNLLVSA